MAIVTPKYKIAPEKAEYRLGQTSGLITVLNAADPVWSCRWTSTQLVAVIKRITLGFATTTAFGTAQEVSFGIYFARSYTVVDSGGTAATLTGDNGKLDTRYPTTAMADMRISTTTAITAGTRTLDTQYIDLFSLGSTAVAVSGQKDFSFGTLAATQPIMLRANEGLVVHVLRTMAAQGVGNFSVTLEWSEVGSNIT